MVIRNFSDERRVDRSCARRSRKARVCLTIAGTGAISFLGGSPGYSLEDGIQYQQSPPGYARACPPFPYGSPCPDLPTQLISFSHMRPEMVLASDDTTYVAP